MIKIYKFVPISAMGIRQKVSQTCSISDMSRSRKIQDPKGYPKYQLYPLELCENITCFSCNKIGWSLVQGRIGSCTRKLHKEHEYPEDEYDACASSYELM